MNEAANRTWTNDPSINDDKPSLPITALNEIAQSYDDSLKSALEGGKLLADAKSQACLLRAEFPKHFFTASPQHGKLLPKTASEIEQKLDYTAQAISNDEDRFVGETLKARQNLATEAMGAARRTLQELRIMYMTQGNAAARM